LRLAGLLDGRDQVPTPRARVVRLSGEPAEVGLHGLDAARDRSAFGRRAEEPGLAAADRMIIAGKPRDLGALLLGGAGGA
jgi:hypothetical protein